MVIPSDREIKPLTHGKQFVPAVDGWFVPDAMMLDIKNALDKNRIQQNNFTR